MFPSLLRLERHIVIGEAGVLQLNVVVLDFGRVPTGEQGLTLVYVSEAFFS